MISSFSFNPCSNCGNEKDFNSSETEFTFQELRTLDRLFGNWDSVDLVCNKCGHSWTLLLSNESDVDGDEKYNDEVEKLGTERGSRFWEDGE